MGVRRAPPTGDEKFIVANGDEGDPGSYIDKVLMEAQPGTCCSRAWRSRATRSAPQHGFVLMRSEYPRSKPALEAAAAEARARGLLGEDILGSGFAFDVTIVEGAGSYVVGEETALLACLQGLRGTVSARPPFPAERGVHGLPTVVNNVETLVQHPLHRRARRRRLPRRSARARRRAPSSSASTSASRGPASTRCRSA